MNKGLARFLTGLVANFIDEHTPADKMCMSSYECELMENTFIKEDFDQIEKFLEKKNPNPKENK